jgi:hypothetical protein
LQCTHPTDAGCVKLQPSPVEMYPDLKYMPYCEGGIYTDGNLNDAFWLDPCNWMPLDQVYDGDPCDITSAEYAVCWGDGLTDPCSMIYAAVRVVDNDQYLVPNSKWNGQDNVEIYVQGDPNGGELWGADSVDQYFDVAQQFKIGKQTTFTTNDWTKWGDGTIPLGGGDPDSADFIGKSRLSGSTLIYEIKAKPWKYYGGRNPLEDSVAPELNPGDHVGFDIVVVTAYGSTPEDGSDGEYGALCANSTPQKFIDAANFQRWELKDYDGSIVPPECGDWGILVADIYFDADCQVGLPDFGVIANEWMDCTDPCSPCSYDPF